MGLAHCGFVQHTFANNSLYTSIGCMDSEEEIWDGHKQVEVY